MVDPFTAYQLTHGCWQLGRFGYRLADRRVANYAEENSLSKQEVWALIGQEAARRGDASMRAAAALGVSAASRGIPLAAAAAERLGRENVRRGLRTAARFTSPLWSGIVIAVRSADAYRPERETNQQESDGYVDDELLLALPPSVVEDARAEADEYGSPA